MANHPASPMRLPRLPGTCISSALRRLLIVCCTVAWGSAGVGCGGGGNDDCVKSCQAQLDACNAKCQNYLAHCICDGSACFNQCLKN